MFLFLTTKKPLASNNTHITVCDIVPVSSWLTRVLCVIDIWHLRKLRKPNISLLSRLFEQVAAQNCRKRKINQISQLSQQVQETRMRKQQLLTVRDDLFRQREEWSSKLMLLQDEVLSAMNKSTKEWTLDMDAQNVALVRRSAMSSATDSSRNGADQVRTSIPSCWNSLANNIFWLANFSWIPCTAITILMPPLLLPQAPPLHLIPDIFGKAERRLLAHLRQELEVEEEARTQDTEIKIWTKICLAKKQTTDQSAAVSVLTLPPPPFYNCSFVCSLVLDCSTLSLVAYFATSRRERESIARKRSHNNQAFSFAYRKILAWPILYFPIQRYSCRPTDNMVFIV